MSKLFTVALEDGLYNYDTHHVLAKDEEEAERIALREAKNVGYLDESSMSVEFVRNGISVSQAKGNDIVIYEI